MSVCISCKSITRICKRDLKTFVTRAVTIRYYSNNAQQNLSKKDTVPVSEPNKIHAAVLKKFSDPISIESLETPKNIQKNEVLIDVQYCALNASDILLAKNAYTFEPSLPMVLGYEIVGKLLEVGDEAQKKGYKTGDKVIAFNKDRYGGLAEQCIAEVGNVWKMPGTVKSLDAVCLMDNYITALAALEQTVEIEENDMILINVGLSGHGLAAVDIATNVFKAEVIGICATEEGTELVRDKGAFGSLKYKDKTLLKQIKEIAAERNIKAVFEGESGEFLKKVLHCFTNIYNNDTSLKDSLRDDDFAVVMHHLSREGRIIIAGAICKTMENETKKQDSFKITGFDLGQYRKDHPEKYREAGDDVLQFLEEGLITPTCSLIVGLNKINDALNFNIKTKSSGKVVIDLKNKDADTSKN